MSEFFRLPYQEQIERMQAAAASALVDWGLGDADLRLIKYRENAVFRVRSGDRRYALRVHRPGYHTDAALASECTWMKALRSAGIQVPAIVPATDGRDFVTRPVDGVAQDVQIDVSRWIEGNQLGSVEDGVEDRAAMVDAYVQLGELAGRVHNQASDWRPPRGFVRHSWDADGLAGQNPFWGRFWDVAQASESQRSLLERVREALHQDLQRLPKDSAGYSMIHADLAPENVMVREGVPRLIDFDDCGYGWHLFELATALYFISDEPYYDDARRALIEGYEAVRPVDQGMWPHWQTLMTARATTYVGWIHTRPHTETAEEMGPWLVESACAHGDEYLSSRG